MILANIIDIFVEIFEGTVSFFDLQIIELAGVQKSGDATGSTDDGKMLKARFVEIIEGERAEKVVFVDEGHFIFGQHDGADGFFGKGHGGGDDGAFFVAEDVFWGATKDVDEF